MRRPDRRPIGSRGRTLALAGLALLAAVFAARAVAAPQAEEEVPLCQGRAATIVGTAADDILRGTPRRDVIWAGPGDDVVLGLGGSDIVCGGPGDDRLHGGDGVDRLGGGPGDDLLYGDLGSDILEGGPGADTLYGRRGNDHLRGGAGDDVLHGGHGDDQIFGEAGDDVLYGNLGIDILRGGRGDDLIDGGYGWDVMDGGPGRDTASFATAVRSAHRGGGVRVSLKRGRATGDGRDRLRRFESLQGSAFDDVLIGKRRTGWIHGGPGRDRCQGVPAARRRSCGRERVPRATAHVHLEAGLHPAASGVVIAAGRGDDDISVAVDPASGAVAVTAKRGIAVHGDCTRPGSSLMEAVCPPPSPLRWLTVDLGPGDDRFRAIGSLREIGDLRVAGGPGDDVLRSGAEDSLLEGDSGADRLIGGGGSDALVGGRSGGPDFLYGGPGGNLLAAGPPCEGGRIVGGSGSDNVSFAELPIQRGVLVASLRRGIAYVKGVRDCRPVRISRSIENLEGSFGADILIGDGRANNMLGQPGADRFYGGGGADIIDARDGGRDIHIQCGAPGRRSGRALVDRSDPAPSHCESRTIGLPIPGLPK